MFSGIGDPEVLRAHAISVQVPLAGVGRNLQNHVSLAVLFPNESTTVRSDASSATTGLQSNLARSRLFGDGLFSMLPTCAIGFVRTDPGLVAPNLQISCTAAADDTRPYLPFTAPSTPDGFSVRAMLLRPLARGALTLLSSNPLKDPVVQQGRGSPADDQTLAEALTTIEGIASQPEMARIIESRALSTIPKDGDSRFDYIRRNTSYLHHPCGTCRMGAAGGR